MRRIENARDIATKHNVALLGKIIIKKGYSSDNRDGHLFAAVKV
jgi:hypothetical protein